MVAVVVGCSVFFVAGFFLGVILSPADVGFEDGAGLVPLFGALFLLG